MNTLEEIYLKGLSKHLSKPYFGTCQSNGSDDCHPVAETFFTLNTALPVTANGFRKTRLTDRYDSWWAKSTTLQVSGDAHEAPATAEFGSLSREEIVTEVYGVQTFAKDSRAAQMMTPDGFGAPGPNGFAYGNPYQSFRAHLIKPETFPSVGKAVSVPRASARYFNHLEF